MEYDDWLRVRAEFALLFEELAVSGTLLFPRDFTCIFTREYHTLLDSSINWPGLDRGALLMTLCMALDDILSHQCRCEWVYSPACRQSVHTFRSSNRSTQRLAETVSLALDILVESDFHSREDHPKYGHVLSMLPWIHTEIVLGRFRDFLSAGEA